MSGNNIVEKNKIINVNNKNILKGNENLNPTEIMIEENNSKNSTEDLNSSNETKSSCLDNYNNNEIQNNGENKDEEKNNSTLNGISGQKKSETNRKIYEENQEVQNKEKDNIDNKIKLEDIYPEDVKEEYMAFSSYFNYNLENNEIDTIINNEDSEKKENIEKNDKEENNSKIIKPEKLDTNLKEPLISETHTNFELVGFKNIGHTCYMNSFLQILIHFPNLINQVKETIKENNMYIELIDNIIKLYDERTNTNYLRKIKSLMGQVYHKYGNYVQNDSQMFGIDLLNEMINLIKNETKFNDSNEFLIKEKIEAKPEISFDNIDKYKKILFKEYKENYNHKEENEICLEKFFQFHEYSIKVSDKDYKNIKLEKVEFETFLDIQLFIPNDKDEWNIVDLIKNKYKFFQIPDNKIIDNKIDIITNTSENENIKIEANPQKIKNNKNEHECSLFSWIESFFQKCISLFRKITSKTDDNNAHKEKNKIIMKRNVYKKFRRLASLPKVLIFSINRAILGRPFNTDIISYEDVLDMSPFVDEDFLCEKKSTKYKLFAINECLGYSRKSGHCYSYIKINNSWYKFNDDFVCEEYPNNASKYVVGLYYIQC